MFFDASYLYTQGSTQVTVIPLSATGQVIGLIVALFLALAALKIEEWVREDKVLK